MLHSKKLLSMGVTASGWRSGQCDRLVRNSAGSQSGWVIPKTIIAWYKLPPCVARMRNVKIWTVRPDYLKGLVVCETVNGDMDLKDVLGSIARVGYCIPVPDFYLVLHGIRCRKGTIIH